MEAGAVAVATPVVFVVVVVIRDFWHIKIDISQNFVTHTKKDQNSFFSEAQLLNFENKTFSRHSAEFFFFLNEIVVLDPTNRAEHFL